MKNNKITMEDISNAIRILNENMPPNKTKEYDWGWLETDHVGNPIKIKLKKTRLTKLKRYARRTLGLEETQNLKKYQKKQN